MNAQIWCSKPRSSCKYAGFVSRTFMFSMFSMSFHRKNTFWWRVVTPRAANISFCIVFDQYRAALMERGEPSVALMRSWSHPSCTLARQHPKPCRPKLAQGRDHHGDISHFCRQRTVWTFAGQKHAKSNRPRPFVFFVPGIGGGRWGCILRVKGLSRMIGFGSSGDFFGIRYFIT